MLSNRKIKSIAHKIDNLNNKIKFLVSEIETSGHPNASEMADTLRENGYDNPARALDCIEDFLPRNGLTKRAPGRATCSNTKCRVYHPQCEISHSCDAQIPG